MKIKSDPNWLFIIGMALFFILACSIFYGIVEAQASVSGLSRSADVGCLQ